MVQPGAKDKDYTQGIKESYDPQLNRLRVDALVNDGEDALVINPDGSINVNVVDSPGTTGEELSMFNAVGSVPSGVQTDIVSYTVPVGKQAYLKYIEVSGSNIAAFDVYQDATLIARRRTYFGSELNEDFDFKNGLLIDAGVQIIVKVLHQRPDVGDFEGRIQVNEV